jgi:hypothetical protein
MAGGVKRVNLGLAKGRLRRQADVLGASQEEEHMGENGSSANGKARPPDDPARTDEESGLVLDDEIRSAATPFLYLLASLVIAVAAYLLYSLLRG